MAYQIPASPEERPGCRDALLITRAVFAAVLPPLIAMVLVILLVSLTVLAFAVHPALALLVAAITIGGILLFARWERGRHAGF